LIKSPIRENGIIGIIDSRLGCRQPHTAHTTKVITTVKDLALIFDQRI